MVSDYPRYSPGDTLPEGLYLPLDDFTHETILNELGQFIFDQLNDYDVDVQIIRELLMSFGGTVVPFFEENAVEYAIATFVNEKKVYEFDQVVEGMANKVSSSASEILMKCIAESPIINFVSRKDLVDVINDSTQFLFDKIIKVKNLD